MTLKKYLETLNLHGSLKCSTLEKSIKPQPLSAKFVQDTVVSTLCILSQSAKQL